MTPKESVLRSKSSEERWHFISDEYESSLSEHFVPKNTKTSTNWAVTNLPCFELQHYSFLVLAIMLSIRIMQKKKDLVIAI